MPRFTLRGICLPFTKWGIEGFLQFCGNFARGFTGFLPPLSAGVIPHIHKSLIGKKGQQKTA